jgi:hypothetical protein
MSQWYVEQMVLIPSYLFLQTLILLLAPYKVCLDVGAQPGKQIDWDTIRCCTLVRLLILYPLFTDARHIDILVLVEYQVRSRTRSAAVGFR